MKRQLKILSILFGLVIAVCVAYVRSGAEIIVAEGIKPSPLYDPASMAGPWGTKLKQVGTLRTGEKLFVVRCNDRKSDIDIEAMYNGRTVVLGGGRGDFVLDRKTVSIWEQHATKSCRGFFDNFNKPT